MRLSRNAQKRGKFAKDLIKTKLGVVEFSVYSAVTFKKRWQLPPFLSQKYGV